MAYYPPDEPTIRRLPNLYRKHQTETTARTGALVNQVFVLALKVLSIEASSDPDIRKAFARDALNMDRERQLAHRIPSILG